MQPRHIRRLFEHAAWADERVGDALVAASGVAPETLAVYAHLVAAELVWLDRLERVPQSVAVWPDDDLVACLARAAESRRRYAIFVATLSESALERRVSYTNSAGASFEDTVEDVLLHVALHGAYHRGQIAQSIRLAGDPTGIDGLHRVRAGCARGVTGRFPGIVAAEH